MTGGRDVGSLGNKGAHLPVGYEGQTDVQRFKRHGKHGDGTVELDPRTTHWSIDLSMPVAGTALTMTASMRQ